MNTERRHSTARAVLGAMAWRIPDDDWHSPWSFENEWVPPGKGTVSKESKEIPEAPVEPAPSPASQSFVPEITPHGVLLHFEEEEPDEPSAPSAPAARPVKPASKFPSAPSAPVSPALSAPAAKTIAAETASHPVAPRSAAVPQGQPAADPIPVPPRPLPRIPRRSHHIAWGSLMSLSLGTLGFTLLAWIYLHDTARESDEDLRPQVAVDQTPTTQATLKLRAFLDSILPVEETALRSQPAWTWDTPSLAAFVRRNGTALDNLRDLLEDYDWHPHHSNWFFEDASSHPSWGHAATLLQAQAAYLARRGDEESAFVAAVDLAELSRRLQEIWAWPGYMQRAWELQTASVQILAELLKSTRLDSAALGRFQEEFIQCRPDEDLLRQACAAYYLHEKKLLLGPASGELLDTMPAGRLHRRPARLFFKTNETLSLFASGFRDLRDDISRPPYTRLSVTASSSHRTRLTSPRFYHPNYSGEAYFSERIGPYLQLPQEFSLAQARHGLVRCLFAIRRYLAARHTLPAQLSDLTPEYLAAIPQDPFSGESLQYDSANGLLYSVGTNLIAEGGRLSGLPMVDDAEPTVALGIRIARPVKK